MPKVALGKSILAVLSMLTIVTCLGVCSWAFYEQQRSIAEVDEYNRRLQQMGIPLTLEGVEDYILKSVKPGMTRDELIQKLQPLGAITSSDLGACEGFAITLENVPGASTKPSDPTNQPPAYGISVCYLNGRVSEVGNFHTLGSYFYTAGLYAGEIRPTVAARLTQTALPKP